MKSPNLPPKSQPQDSFIHGSPDITRRKFLAGAGATALGFTILKPELLTGAEANSKINIGVIGCGGRGAWIAELFAKNGNYNIVALADYFQDRVDAAGSKVNVPQDKRFTGLSAYKRLLEQKLDAVAIISPPYFHPEQAAAAVEAGKHVYLAKPVAVDVPGCKSVAASGHTATQKKLAFRVDFQTRAMPSYREVVSRIHKGDIGKLITVYAEYQTNLMFEDRDSQLRKDPNNPEVRLRSWGIDRVLSGDVITEQNIHALDVAAWIIDAEPIKAYGTGGRSRPFLGDCWDHFSLLFFYPNDLVVAFSSKQAGFASTTSWSALMARPAPWKPITEANARCTAGKTCSAATRTISTWLVSRRTSPLFMRTLPRATAPMPQFLPASVAISRLFSAARPLTNMQK